MQIKTSKLTRIHIVSDDSVAADILKKSLKEHFSVGFVDVAQHDNVIPREREDLKADLLFVDPERNRRSTMHLLGELSAMTGHDTKIVLYAGRSVNVDVEQYGNFFWILPKDFELKELFLLMIRFYESRLAILPPPHTHLKMIVSCLR